MTSVCFYGTQETQIKIGKSGGEVLCFHSKDIHVQCNNSKFRQRQIRQVKSKIGGAIDV